MSWTDGSWFVPTEGGADNSLRATGPAATTGAAAAEGATNADAGAQSNPFAILDTGNLYGGDEPPPLIDADVGGNSALGWPPGGSGSALGDFGGATGVEKWGADPYGVGQEATSAPAGTTPGLGRTEADARQESAVACPLVDAERRSLAELEGEYEASATLRGKIAALRRRLGDGRAFYRRVRGDGNCFFRGASFAYLESVALAPHDVRRAEAARLHAALGAARPKMCAAGMLELVFEDQLEMLQEWAEQLGKGDLPPEVLLAHFNDDVTSNSVVMFLRMLASSEMAAREDFFAPFVADDTITFATFRNKTEAMGEESDHPAIVALSDALGVSLRVIYLDASGGDQAEANTIDFTPESAGKDIVPITLMYRPGHYDILCEGTGTPCQ